MLAHVTNQLTFGLEGETALLADVWPFVGVRAHVNGQVSGPRRAVRADATLVRLLIRVQQIVSFECVSIGR